MTAVSKAAVAIAHGDALFGVFAAEVHSQPEGCQTEPNRFSFGFLAIQVPLALAVLA